MSSRSIGFSGQPNPRGAIERAGYLHVAEPSEATRSQMVFVVHGRNTSARLAIFEFLRSIGLCPIEWHQAIAATGKASPYISEVVDAGIQAARPLMKLSHYGPNTRMGRMTPMSVLDSSHDPMSYSKRVLLSAALPIASSWPNSGTCGTSATC